MCRWPNILLEPPDPSGTHNDYEKLKGLMLVRLMTALQLPLWRQAMKISLIRSLLQHGPSMPHQVRLLRRAAKPFHHVCIAAISATLASTITWWSI
jgi:hypothetical protein